MERNKSDNKQNAKQKGTRAKTDAGPLTNGENEMCVRLDGTYTVCYIFVPVAWNTTR